MSKKQFLPIAIDVTDKKILIIGGGEDAYKKLKILQRSTNLIEIIAPKIISWIKNSGIVYHEQQYHKNFLKDYYLIYSCVDDPSFVKQLIRDCRDVNVLLNVHDQPEFCEFVSPAIYKRENISIAVSSNGEDVYKSIQIRNQLKDYFENYRLQKLLIAN